MCGHWSPLLKVSEVISSIRQVSKSALKADAKPKQEADDAFYNSQKFEVLYCGKVTVLQKKAAVTLIDDCIDKFRLHEVERKRLRLPGGRRGSTEGACVEFLMGGGGEPISSALNESIEYTEGPGGEDMTGGGGEINLISPESKTVVLEKNFKDISSCCQGVKRSDHFGFIGRDKCESGPSQYVCYVFQCASESLVDEVMLTLKQAFTTAAALQSNQTQVQICEACPMHDLHKLCERIEGLYPPRAKLAIQKYLSQLSDNEQAEIFERRLKPGSDQEENELVVLHLRQLCGTKQKSHLHIGEVPNDSGTVHFLNVLPVDLCVSDHYGSRELLPLSPCGTGSGLDPLGRPLPPAGSSLSGERPKRTGADYRALWKTAIHQQILLLRMEKENQRLEASRDELHIRKMKLNYQEVGQCSTETLALWDRKLTAPGRTTLAQNKEELHGALCQGVPKSRRGEVWLLLSHQYRLRHRLPQRQQALDVSYQDLLKQLTAQQHSILVDLGRTFPTHQYFSAQLGAGQLSLYNLLKAYSLLDTEVGYCQGISFVAGVLLLHMSEEQAFDMLKFLMYDLGIRQQFRPDMVSLQVQMYQLSRLLHDYHRDLYNHLEEHEIGPSLYAAPWFLTLFASQFPLNFVSRVFDFVFVEGTGVIFKVALCLLSSREGEIVECDSFESIVDYLKTTLPALSQTQMEETIAKVTEMDISKQLHAYEVEYHVLQDEMLEAGPLPDDSDRLDKLEKTNVQLKKQNMDLLEKLQVEKRIQTLETSVENFLSRESKMKHMIRSLEQDRAAHQKTIERMRSCVPPDALTDVEMTQFKTGPNGKAKTAAKKP
uniref:TBC1 domain family member 4 n=1 Tax=Gasterosteus aculeatus aculeatus TaxID=481459 RepID=A0AAQ4S553_GASAC